MTTWDTSRPAEPLQRALNAPERSRLLAYRRTFPEGRRGAQEAAAALGLDRQTLAAALSEETVNRGTRDTIAIGLDRWEAERLSKNMDVVDRALAPRGLMVDRSAVERSLANRTLPCPRCLDIEPGTPAKGPDNVMACADQLCGPCQVVVDAALRAEQGR